MSYRVFVSPEAQADIDRAINWLADNHPEEARHWSDDIAAALLSLESFPTRTPRVRRSQRLRQLVAGRYRLIFVVEGNDVEVMRVAHGSRRVRLPH